MSTVEKTFQTFNPSNRDTYINLGLEAEAINRATEAFNKSLTSFFLSELAGALTCTVGYFLMRSYFQLKNFQWTASLANSGKTPPSFLSPSYMAAGVSCLAGVWMLFGATIPLLKELNTLRSKVKERENTLKTFGCIDRLVSQIFSFSDKERHLLDTYAPRASFTPILDKNRFSHQIREEYEVTLKPMKFFLFYLSEFQFHKEKKTDNREKVRGTYKPWVDFLLASFEKQAHPIPPALQRSLYKMAFPSSFSSLPPQQEGVFTYAVNNERADSRFLEITSEKDRANRVQIRTPGELESWLKSLPSIL